MTFVPMESIATRNSFITKRVANKAEQLGVRWPPHAASINREAVQRNRRWAPGDITFPLFHDARERHLVVLRQLLHQTTNPVIGLGSLSFTAYTASAR